MKLSNLAAVAPLLAALLSSVPVATPTAPTIAAPTHAPAKAVQAAATLRDEYDEEALVADLMRARRIGGSTPRHRRPGERAHRRWRKARASGRRGAHRG